MTGVAVRALRWTGWIAIALLAAGIVLVAVLETIHPAPERYRDYGFYFSIFKWILGGFVVAMLGIVIPQVVSDERYRFERMRESRIAYSEAKTGIDYLKIRLATLPLAEATALVQQAHYKKHHAELFDELTLHLRRRYGPDMTPEIWDETMYRKLFGTRRVLEENVGAWDGLTGQQRIRLLDSVLPTVSEI